VHQWGTSSWKEIYAPNWDKLHHQNYWPPPPPQKKNTKWPLFFFCIWQDSRISGLYFTRTALVEEGLVQAHSGQGRGNFSHEPTGIPTHIHCMEGRTLPTRPSFDAYEWHYMQQNLFSPVYPQFQASTLMPHCLQVFEKGAKKLTRNLTFWLINFWDLHSKIIYRSFLQLLKLSTGPNSK